MDASPFYYAVWASAGGALILGAVLNLLLLMMIRRHSPPELHAFSSLLAQTVVIDLHVVVFTFLVMPICFTDGDVGTVLTLGPLGVILPFPWNNAAFSLWLLLISISTQQYGTQFFYRYCLICRNSWRVPRLLFWTFFLAPGSLITCASFATSMLTTVDQPLVLRQQDIAIALGMPLPGPAAGYAERISLSNRVNQIYVGAIIVIHVLINIVVVVFALKICRFVHKNFKGPNETKRRDVNRQLTTTMLIQAFLPILLSTLPLFIALTGLWRQSSLSRSSSIVPLPLPASAAGGFNALLTASSMLVIYWIPVLNPVVTLATISPYRHALAQLLFGWCCCSFCKVAASNIVAPANEVMAPINLAPAPKKGQTQREARTDGQGGLLTPTQQHLTVRTSPSKQSNNNVMS